MTGGGSNPGGGDLDFMRFMQALSVPEPQKSPAPPPSAVPRAQAAPPKTPPSAPFGTPVGAPPRAATPPPPAVPAAMQQRVATPPPPHAQAAPPQAATPPPLHAQAAPPRAQAPVESATAPQAPPPREGQGGPRETPTKAVPVELPPGVKMPPPRQARQAPAFTSQESIAVPKARTTGTWAKPGSAAPEGATKTAGAPRPPAEPTSLPEAVSTPKTPHDQLPPGRLAHQERAETAPVESAYTAEGGRPESGDDLPFLARADLTPLFQEMIKRKASDLHIGTLTPPTFRIDGDFYETEYFLPEEAELTETLLGYLSDAQRRTFLQTGDLDFALDLPGIARFRVNYYKKYKGVSAAFRPIPMKIPQLDSLGLPPVLRTLADLRRGLVIITGPTGSGKSTTLAAIINEINLNRSNHIVTIEDPVEFVHESRMSLITHREIGINATSFSDALRAAVREDPDIVLVGEMRDLDTIYQSIKAAEMGLLVFGTLHTNNASRAVDRIIDVFPPEQQDQVRTMLADSLKAVVAQQLVKKSQTEGRVAAIEILLAVPGFSNLIREGKIHQIPSIIQTGKDVGMQSMDQSLIDLVNRRLISRHEALSRAVDLRTFQRAGITTDTGGGDDDDW